MSFSLPSALIERIGPILALETPFQGGSFVVNVVTTPHGRFVLKTGDTPAKKAELVDETRVLAALPFARPLVAQPLGQVEDIFLFTYVVGENLVVVMQDADAMTRHHFVAEFGRILRRLHTWAPDLPRPTDWLAETFVRLGTFLETRPPEMVVWSTNTRFDGRNARELLTELRMQQVQMQGKIVFGHGDYCLPNVLAHHGKASGIIDWSRGGYADLRCDLATGIFTLRYNQMGDPAYLHTFLDAYGYDDSVASLGPFEALHALMSLD